MSLSDIYEAIQEAYDTVENMGWAVCMDDRENYEWGMCYHEELR